MPSPKACLEMFPSQKSLPSSGVSPLLCPFPPKHVPTAVVSPVTSPTGDAARGGPCARSSQAPGRAGRGLFYEHCQKSVF